ncbi:MAG: regulatory protein RecX [Chthonomonadaceae bacterium]|nr:regulatory protein RecX [Chthonomonadaceae bacterium]
MDSERLEEARKIALKFLAGTARSAVEIERRLSRADFEPEYIEAVIEEAKSRGWVDDTAFAQAWVEDRADRKGYGKTRLAQEMRGKGLDKETISDALGEIAPEAETQRAKDVAQSRWDKIHRDGLDSATVYAEKQKLSQFLLRRGFSYPIVRQVIAEVTQNNEE